MKRKILFVINPISGGKSKTHLPAIIKNKIDPSKWELDIFWWKDVSQLRVQLQNFVQKGGEVIVVVGGDGTVNLVCQEIINTEVLLAIAPMGSGNGLARQTGFNQSFEVICNKINNSNVENYKRIDVGKVNDQIFVNVAGIGFDAHISKVFSKLGKRGLKSYASAVMMEFKSFQSSLFNININGEKADYEAFMVNVANGTQWGNDFYIAPEASLDDGLLDLIIVRKPSLMQISSLFWSLKMRKNHACITKLRSERIEISSDSTKPSHVDGEPLLSESYWTFEVIKNAVKILTID